MHYQSNSAFDQKKEKRRVSAPRARARAQVNKPFYHQSKLACANAYQIGLPHLRSLRVRGSYSLGRYRNAVDVFDKLPSVPRLAGSSSIFLPSFFPLYFFPLFPFLSTRNSHVAMRATDRTVSACLSFSLSRSRLAPF